MKKIYFEKERKLDKLAKTKHEDLFLDLVSALVQTKNITDAALFLQDLLTRKEAQNLSKRLRIAKLLIEGKTYEEIEEKINVSHATIAKIAIWLEERGDGFRKIIEKLPKKRDGNADDLKIFDWDKFKRKHSMYFWPELLLEKIMQNADKREKDQIKSVLNKLDEKNELHRRLEKLLKY